MTAGETEASAANTKTYGRTTADMQWRRRSDAHDARRRRANGEDLVEYTMESASARAANEKESSTESRHDKNEQRCEKDEEIEAFIEERKIIKDDKERWKDVSKKIKRCTRDKKEQRDRRRYRKYWKKSNQEHSNIKSARKKTLIPKIREE